MSLYATIHSHLPEGWTLSNLIFLDPNWQANIADGEGVVVATGETIEESLTNAKVKAYEGKYVGKFKFEHADNSPTYSNLAERLGLIPKTTIRRR